MRVPALFVLVLLCAACSATASPAPQPTSAPAPPVPTPTVAAPSPTTPPSPVPTPSISPSPSGASRAVAFDTEDGAKLAGTFYGSGPRAVILGNSSDGLQSSWLDVPQQLAARGYLVLTFDWRGLGASQGPRNIRVADKDLLAAINFTRAQGATRVVLVGASLGGMAGMKNGSVKEVAGLIVIGSPRSHPQIFEVTEAELRGMVVPKLFIASRGDNLVKSTDTVAAYEMAPQPKALYLYEGSAHGTDILKTGDRDSFIKMLLDFVTIALS